MNDRFEFHTPGIGKPVRVRLTHDNKNPGNLFFRSRRLAFTMTAQQAIDLANHIADLLETPNGNRAA